MTGHFSKIKNDQSKINHIKGMVKMENQNWYVNAKMKNGFLAYIIDTEMLPGMEVVYVGSSYEECKEAIQYELET